MYDSLLCQSTKKRKKEKEKEKIQGSNWVKSWAGAF